MNNQNNIGYKNPPIYTQFKKGQSGNKNGRPKGRKKLDINAVLQKELQSKILTKDGQRLTKFEAIVKQVVNKSVIGDSKSTKTVFSMINKADNFDVSKLFCDKLVKEGFINPEDMKDYVYNSKYLDINKKFSAIDKMDYEIFRRKTMAFEAVKTVFILHSINLLIMTIFLVNEIFMTIKNEFSFWDGVQKSFELLNISEQKRIETIQKLEQTREYDMPTDDLYNTASTFQELSYKNIFVHLSGYIKILESRMYYDEQKKYWFSYENQSKLYEHLNDETSKEYLDNFQTGNKSFYNKDFISCFSEVEIDLDVLTTENLIALMKWYKGKENAKS